MQPPSETPNDSQPSQPAGQAPGQPSLDWSPCIQALTPRLLAWCHLRLSAGLRASIEPQDIVQAIWTRVWTLHAEASSLPLDAQVFKIANYVLLEHCRRYAAHPRPGSSSPLDHVTAEATTVCSRLARNEGLTHFMAQVATWDPTDQQVFRMVGLEGQAQSQVGERLNLSRDAVAKRWQRLRERIVEAGPPEGVLRGVAGD